MVGSSGEPGTVSEPSPAISFPIVGIGASAGGLDAFRRLLGALPKDTGMAYVLVQHLDPSHGSMLTELLSETTQMEVAEVTGDVRVQSNCVYVIPPSKGLILADGLLKLVPRGQAGGAHMPIDSFLRSLADTQGSQAIGVILSGMGSDGTLGLRAIEAQGGIVFAQEPASAKYQDMPRSAIASGYVDFVLPPEDIAHELTRLGRHPYLAPASAQAEPALPPTETQRAASVVPAREEHETLLKILELLRQAGGTDFGAYKKTTLRRRIARRMAVRCIQTLSEYAQHLQGDVAELQGLYEDCLISVTSFFRDPEVFQALSRHVAPRLRDRLPVDGPLRVWVPGCATGEEAYSIAICLLEQTGDLTGNPGLQIFATDLSEKALTKARLGVYPANIVQDVSEERLSRFFYKVGENYQISKAIRELCVFARHDLTGDPPYSRMDLISCRNVLIYLEPPLQERVFATFHYALRPEGFLLIGPAETVGSSTALFATLDEPRRIYAKQVTSGPPALLAARRDMRPSRASGERLPSSARGVSDVPREVDRMLLARFAPAAVVVDAGLSVLEFRGDTDPFLDHGQGKASLEVEHLLRRGLLMEFRLAVEEVRRTELPVRKEGLRVRHQDQLRDVSIEIVPIKGRAAAERCLLILFNTVDQASHSEGPAPSPLRADDSDAKDRENVRLTLGLAQSTEYMHSLVREHEAALEELQATTEEALSGNEELQSLNEELQTAKEEIQSANEELSTLNQELQERNALLAKSNDEIQRMLDDANALVDTVPQPLVILDSELRVEKANIAFYETFRSTPERTRDRRLTELDGRQWDEPALLEALKKLLASGTSVEDLELEAEFPEIGVRALSLNARRLHAGPGKGWRVLLAIQDRTLVRQAERGREALLALEHEARESAEAADHLKDQFVATVSHELRGPLTVISGWVNVLVAAGKHVEPETVQKALAAIGRGVNAQNRLISDLLEHSRIVTGKVEVLRAAIDLLLVAEAALVGVRAAAEAKDIELQLSGDPATSVILGDADRMQQVLWNLFLNAIKFTPRGGKVWIAVGRVGNQVDVSVRDTGCGISGDFLPHVFDRFRQAEGASNRSQLGLGLGLTLVRELVELHGGTVRAESAGPNRGSTFTVTLPIPALLLPPDDVLEAVDLEAEAAQPPSMPPMALLALPRDVLAGVKVLVVDDESDARGALVGLLERYGALVRSAASVAEAMSALQLELPDVLVSDIGMPGEDGYELMRRVRLLSTDGGGLLPSLAVSAYATEDHKRKVLQSGFRKHLEKPVSPVELVSEVARLVSPL